MADAQIAAFWLVQGAICATRSVKDFAHTGVELVDPWSVGGMTTSEDSPTCGDVVEWRFSR
ncbi:hypothetical protein [Tsukamurella sp. PLM1]|uniref:hypothetical protein n=1 Tax=Tsukamurella sp. PLM1 TaxID=2929795 RepID=UPI0020C1550B|nr:hypothetical protein [Tsukamurella sp. PLM1]